MVKKISRRRSKSARELAKQYGVCISTIKSLVAEDRPDYEARARSRREQAYRLKQEGFKVKDIAVKMDCSAYAVASLIKQYRAKDNTH